MVEEFAELACKHEELKSSQKEQRSKLEELQSEIDELKSSRGLSRDTWDIAESFIHCNQRDALHKELMVKHREVLENFA